MFGCTKIEKNAVISKREIKSKIRTILEDINNNIFKNIKLHFLILLLEEDYNKYLYLFSSKKDKLKNQKSKFPGNLIIERFSNLDNLEYKIENNALPRVLYIMLPKEKIFIDAENFTLRYIDSKLDELKNIFMFLNAKSVKITRNFDSTINNSINNAINVPINNLNIISEIGYQKKEENTNELINNMIFSQKNSNIKLEELYNDNYFFLPKQNDWHNMIIRRIEGNLLMDEYIYINKETQLLKYKFIQTLAKLDLSISYDWEKYQNLTIKYEIEYYPLKDDLEEELLLNDDDDFKSCSSE